jgi:hypothetical protein
LSKEIPLTQGFVALVDDEDYERIVAAGPWQLRRSPHAFYALHGERSPDGTNVTTYMHRLILDAPAGLQVDHINRDGLDNRKQNMRLCSRSENRGNTIKQRGNYSSRYKGVSRHGQAWQAHIGENGVLRHLGTFSSETEAAEAYDSAAKERWGEFALTNF